MNIFLSINSNMCFEYSRHMFWLKNKKNIFSNTILPRGMNKLD